MGSKLDDNKHIISEINSMNNDHETENTLLLQDYVSKNEKHKKKNNLQNMSTNRNRMNYHIFQEFEFKWKARKISIWFFVDLCVIMLINLFYLNGQHDML